MNSLLAWIAVSLCWHACEARADIYFYRDQDGALSLSNVPSDSRFKALIVAPRAEMAPTAHSVSGKSDLDALISSAAQNYGVDAALLYAVIEAESQFNPRAVSKKGAVGLMQIMPGTAARYGVIDAYDPAQNLDAGTRYLRDLLTIFGSNLSLALAAYNAGETTVAKYGNRIPPIRETMNYVPRVLNFYRRYSAGH